MRVLMLLILSPWIRNMDTFNTGRRMTCLLYSAVSHLDRNESSTQISIHPITLKKWK